MPELLKVVTPQAVASFLDTRNYEPKLGDFLFPNVKTDELEIEMIKGAYGKPVVATFHEFGTEAQIGTRPGLAKAILELGLIKRKLPIHEKEIIKFRNPRTPLELKKLLDARYNDIDLLVQGVLARAEAFKMEALATGKVVIDENGFKQTIDYGMPADQKLILNGSDALTSPWTADTADIMAQIQSWVNTMAGKGVIVDKIVMSTTAIALMQKNTGIKAAVNGTNTAKFVSLNDINVLFEAAGLPKIVKYDETYLEENADGKGFTSKRYFPEDYVSLIPAENLGSGYFGPTAEEGEFIADGSVDITKVGNVVAQVYKTPDPVVHWTKAVGTFMASFEAADRVMSVKIK